MPEENMERCSVSSVIRQTPQWDTALYTCPGLAKKRPGSECGHTPGEHGPLAHSWHGSKWSGPLGHSLAATHGGSGRHMTRSSMPKTVPKRADFYLETCECPRSLYSQLQKGGNSPSAHQRVKGETGRVP